MESLDQIMDTQICNDVENRRMKNRERQRRYRARKRLKAHTDQVSITTISTHLNGNSTNCLKPPVHCKRNWKKDARLAHMLKPQIVPSTTCINENEFTILSFGGGAEVLQNTKLCFEKFSCSENLETSVTVNRRRDWKAEARSKNKEFSSWDKNLETSVASNRRRDWKAEARNKNNKFIRWDKNASNVTIDA